MDCITKLKASVHNPFYDNMFSQYFIANTEIKLDDNKICIAPLTDEEFWAKEIQSTKNTLKIYEFSTTVKAVKNIQIAEFGFIPTATPWITTTDITNS